jgi:hypothetical protein
MGRIYETATYVFDPLHYYWEDKNTQRAVAGVLVGVFVAALFCIELKRHGLLPAPLDGLFNQSHFQAVNIAFTLVLIIEVIGLIFTVPCSISKAVGKQLEILALILLRSSFKELSAFPEPIRVQDNMDALFRIAADGAGAILIFVIMGVYILLHRRTGEEGRPGPALYRFVAAKKIVAIVLVAIFAGMGGYNCWLFLSGRPTFEFFTDFYTVLIFSDILLVLVSQRYFPAFRAVFRNSGFALATLLMRFALTAPPYWNAGIGIGAAILAVGLTLTYNAFYVPKPGDRPKNWGRL